MRLLLTVRASSCIVKAHTYVSKFLKQDTSKRNRGNRNQWYKYSKYAKAERAILLFRHFRKVAVHAHEHQIGTPRDSW